MHRSSRSGINYLAWDFDGTLAERPGMWSEAISEAADLEGVTVGAEALRPHLQQGFPWHSPEVIRADDYGQWWVRLESLFSGIFVSHFQIEAPLASRIARQVKPVYTDASRWRVFNDVKIALEDLSAAGWRHVILSNHVPELDELVARLDLDSHFEAIFSSGRTGVEKPNPAAFKIVRDHAGPESRVVMVGDSWRADICGARLAGWESVLVRRHHPEAELSCPDLRGLLALLDAVS